MNSGRLLLAVCLAAGCPREAPPDPEDELRRMAQRDAEVDIAEGRGAILITRQSPVYDAVYDGASGLPFHVTGGDGEVAVFNDAYNHAVMAWIATKGTPPGSVKARLVDRMAIGRLLDRGWDLKPGSSLRLDDGTRFDWTNDVLRIEGGSFVRPFEHALPGDDVKARVAVAPGGQIVLRVRPVERGCFSPDWIVQVDPECRCFLASF
jgi:hypothetical protein